MRLPFGGKSVCHDGMAEHVETRAANRGGRGKCVAAVLALLVIGLGCGARPEAPEEKPSRRSVPSESSAREARRVREPAVAGLFYPGEAKKLSGMIDTLLASAPDHSIPRLKGLVCPHAGYEFSGATAAIAYKLLAGRDVRTVVVMGASHYALLQGVSLPDADAYRTPLGLAPISERARSLAGVAPFAREPRCPVRRPDWWRQASKAAPEAGQDTPETWEHSVEVQVPFLQKVLPDFQLLPMILGEVNPEQVARALAEQWDDKTIVVASTDLSHFHAYETARGLDRRCLRAIEALDLEAMSAQEACGKLPVLALLHLARQKGWKAQVLDYRNSGDVSGDKNRVVGYAAVAFYAPGPEQVAASERKFLLELARRTLRSVTASGGLPEVADADVPPKLREKRACFVTLTKGGALRGCIGHLTALEPLHRAVAENARNAALRDGRFPPVQAGELDEIRIEISVLTEPQPLAFTSPDDLLAKLRPHEDGVLLRIGARTATFLPQVWAQLPDKVQFLEQLSRKAGGDASAWRGKDVTLSIYHVECFAEEPPRS
ncbi:MAG TPA: AmmeMemoRadiSam system protein B [Verrucomicrobiota bacterium]|nr:AmmeMemoRadiSam system protein B [Verrucomicrobiota bacterium]